MSETFRGKQTSNHLIWISRKYSSLRDQKVTLLWKSPQHHAILAALVNRPQSSASIALTWPKNQIMPSQGPRHSKDPRTRTSAYTSHAVSHALRSWEMATAVNIGDSIMCAYKICFEAINNKAKSSTTGQCSCEYLHRVSLGSGCLSSCADPFCRTEVLSWG